jgi:hypothetical protein
MILLGGIILIHCRWQQKQNVKTEKGQKYNYPMALARLNECSISVLFLLHPNSNLFVNDMQHFKKHLNSEFKIETNTYEQEVGSPQTSTS